MVRKKVTAEIKNKIKLNNAKVNIPMTQSNNDHYKPVKRNIYQENA